MNNNSRDQSNRPQGTRGIKGNRTNPLSRINFTKVNNPVNEVRILEEKKIKENLELLPEWLSNAVTKINGTNYNTNTFFIENYQKIATAELEVCSFFIIFFFL